jgi:hypothetical protein
MKKPDSKELIISVYLNQRIVFDLIAMLQDGMSAVTRIESVEGTKESDGRRYGAAFGLSQALSSLLKIDVSGSVDKLKEESKDRKTSEERVHTPSSLFHKLRTELNENKIVISVEKDYEPAAGDFVEFNTRLRRNPLLQIMDTFAGLMDIAAAFEAEPQKQRKQHLLKSQKSEFEKLTEQVNKFSEGLKSGGTIDVVSEPLSSGHRAVITLEEQYLNDPSMADLVDGDFTVLGKVTRAINDSNDSVSLLRKGIVGAVNNEMLSSLFAPMFVAAKNANLNLPEQGWEIEGPVIQVIPVAIFA